MTAGVLAVAPCVLLLVACGTKQASTSLGPGGPAGGTPTVSATAGTATAEPGQTTVPASSPASQPAGRIVVGRSGKVTLTQSDNGATVVLARGQMIIVVLGGQGLASWDQPLVAGSGTASLRRTSASGGYPSHAPARATFLAVGPGRATVRSITDAACLHTKPTCAIAQQVWQVSVIVKS